MRRLLIAAEERSLNMLASRSEFEDGRYCQRAYRVSVIVSTYRSEEFIGECLEILANQTLQKAIEIIVIDASSPEYERAIIRTFQQTLDNLRYVRTPERIGIYAAWNLGVRLSSAPYLTTLSTNDGLRKEAYELLASALDRDSRTMLVYGDTLITTVAHERFDRTSAALAYLWPPYRYEDHLDNVTVGPHAMWRRSLHAKIGYFDTRYRAIADQDFWLRIGRIYQVLHIPEFTGLYWHDNDSLSSRHLQEEWPAIRAKHRQRRVPAQSPLTTTVNSDTNAGGEIARYESLLAAYPEIGFVHGLLGQRYFQAGETTKSVAQMRRAMVLQPGNVQFRRIFLMMLLRTGSLEIAVVEGEAILALTPDDISLLLLLGDLCIKLQRNSQARQYYGEILRRDPSHAGAIERLRHL